MIPTEAQAAPGDVAMVCGNPLPAGIYMQQWTTSPTFPGYGYIITRRS